MPFGLVFGAVVFAILGARAGWQLSSLESRSAAALGAVVALLGIILALGLLTRQRWARWCGALAALVLAAAWGVMVFVRGDAMDLVGFVAPAVAVALLLVPATGDPRRNGPPGLEPYRKAGKVLAWAAAACVVAVSALGSRAVHDAPSSLLSWRTSKPADPAATSPATPLVSTGRAPAPAAEVEWVDFGRGLQRARATGRPVLVDFFATWCGVCSAMDRRTFRNPDVMRRLGEIVTVRVDSEETRARDGVRGVDLAERFGIRGYPTFVILGPDGRELSRRTGFLAPWQLIRWLDEVGGGERFGHAADVSTSTRLPGRMLSLPSSSKRTQAFVPPS